MTRDPLITIYFYTLSGDSGEEDDREVRAAKVKKSQLRTDSDGNLCCCDDVDRELGTGFTRVFLRFNEAKAALKKHWKTSMEWARFGYREAMLCRKPKDPPVVEPLEEN